MKILIAGDFFISDAFENKDLLDKTIIDEFKKADLRLINQEAPITKNIAAHKIIKTGPHLQSDYETTIPYLQRLSVDVATLANNHILDYGSKGLTDTFSALKKADIDFVGAGNNFTEASKPFTFEKGDVKVAILNFAENEWSTTVDNTQGANPLDIIENVKQIQKAKATHDKVVCIIHGGHEYYQLPSPRMQKQYRFYVDNGADAIVGHHTHCISGHEVYKNAPIIYSLGNFLFTMSSSYPEWYQGLIAKLSVNKVEPIGFELVPIEQNKQSFKVSLIDNQEKRILVEKQVEMLSEEIQNAKNLEANWASFVASKKNNYQSFLSPLIGVKNKYLRALIHRSGINKFFMNCNQKTLMLNIFRCEAHKDLMQASLEEKADK